MRAAKWRDVCRRQVIWRETVGLSRLLDVPSGHCEETINTA
ncbi:MAG: hypothetical protein ACI9HK_000170 [Pirellulaceae bacterium]|jgi:hypothetical protein